MLPIARIIFLVLGEGPTYVINGSFGSPENESGEEPLKGNVCNFSVDYNGIDKSDILNIHKYLMDRNNIR